MEITNPILIFSFIMFMLLLAPILSTKIRLPEIIGLILFGVIVGPHGFKFLRPEGSIDLFSSVGLIYLMFLAGLEINIHEFNRQKKYSIIFGSLTFFIPMFLGTFGSRILFQFSWPTAILLASMFASHTLISFPVATNLGIARERSVVAAVGGTIITDTAAMLVLAIIAEYVVTSLSAAFWVRQILLLLALVWFSLWLLPRIAQFFLRILAPDDKVEFILILALVFLNSHLAHLAGVEPIIGAFLAGLSLSQIVSDQSPLMNRLHFIGHSLFIPFFLLSVGMLVDIRVLLASQKVWAVAIFMVVCAIFCKYAAGVLFARIMNFSKDEGGLIFGLSVNQAAATLAAVVIGLKLQIFDEAILNGTIIMIMVTCILGPIITEKYGKKIALNHVKTPNYLNPLTERVMVAVGRGESAELLTDIATAIRSESSKDPLLPVYIVQDGENLENKISLSEKILSKAVARAASMNIPVTPINRIDVNIASGILHAAKEWRADSLVIGASRYHTNFETMLFGIYDKISNESQQLFFLCQISHFLSTDKKIYFFIPPMSELERGFNRSLESVKTIAVKNKLQLHTMATMKTIVQAKKILHAQAIAAPSIFTEIDQWKEFSDRLENIPLEKNDALIILSPRKGRLGWRPSLERLHHNLCQRFPDNNIFLIHQPDPQGYPPEHNLSSAKAITKNISDRSILTHPAVDVTEKTALLAVKTLLEIYFKNDTKKISGLIEKLKPFEPIELTPDILLLHTHFSEIKQPIILLGVNHGNFCFPPLNKASRAFFVLISPEGETALHLQTLADVARFAQQLQLSNK